MDVTLSTPEGKKRVITEEVTTTTTKRTIVEDPEIAGASQLGKYICNDYHTRIQKIEAGLPCFWAKSFLCDNYVRNDELSLRSQINENNRNLEKDLAIFCK